VFILPVLFFLIAFIKFDFFRAKAQQHHAPAAVTSTNAKSDSEMQKTALTKDSSLSHNVESKLGYAPAIVPPVANPDVLPRRRFSTDLTVEPQTYILAICWRMILRQMA
jgi:hypothetical protein